MPRAEPWAALALVLAMSLAPALARTGSALAELERRSGEDFEALPPCLSQD